jgi:acetyltransferase
MPTLSESASKELLSTFGVPFPAEHVVRTAEEAVGTVEEAVAAAGTIGHPVVVKLGGDGIAHKTERGLVRLNLGSDELVRTAAAALLEAATPDDGEVHLLVAPMLSATRELIAGLHRDEQFGTTVMLGIGGILAEAVADVVFRLAPITRADALAMVDDLATQPLLGAFRGEPPVDRNKVADVLTGLSAAALDRPEIVSADLNPLLIVDGAPVAVDALVELAPDVADSRQAVGRTPTTAAGPTARALASSMAQHNFSSLFDPRGVVVAGASSHPGKFGFVALHNILASGYEGKVFATNRDGAEVLGIECARAIDELPDGEIDLVFVCTPAAANEDVLRACAKKGITAAFVSSAGYGEADEAGQRAQIELATLADDLGILLAGPNGQGVVSTPSKLCAQIVAPYPPAGHIGIASQSGNFVSSFQNYATQSGIGVSRAVSAGNAAAVGVPDYFEFFAEDPATKVALGYVEGVGDGRAFYDRLSEVTARLPVVLVKGGATAGGQRAAASHTGSLASNDRIFDGMCRQAGINRADTVEQAYDVAATFAGQPLPRGNRVAVVTTAGGWGVVTADALSRSDLDLLVLPDDLRIAVDEHLPPRWSRNNPIDLAGGETRDTVPAVLNLVADHDDVDAVIFLGMGIQSNQAKLMRGGRFYPDEGLERIVAYHERQDTRFAQAAIDASERSGKPVLVATELAIAAPDNPGVATLREAGRLCYASANRAVHALDHLWRRARWLRQRERADEA